MAQTVKKLEPNDVRTTGDRDVNFWADLTQRMQEDQALVEREQSASRTENEDSDTWQVFSNDAKVVIYKGASMLARVKPRIRMPLPAKSDAQRKAAVQMTEDGVRYMWEEFGRRHTQGFGNNLEFDLWQWYFLRGLVAARILQNPNNEDFLWDLMIADPITVFPIFAGKRLVRVSHVYWSTKAEVEADFYEDEGEKTPDWLQAMKDDDLLKIYAYYDRNQMMVTSDKSGDEWIRDPRDHGLRDENGNGLVPWVIRSAVGAPYRSTDNQQTGWQKFVAESMLARVRDQIENKEQVLAILHDLVEKSSEPPLVIKSNAAGDLEIDTRAGGRNFLAPTDDVKDIYTGPKIQDLSALGSEYTKMIERGTWNDILFGQGDPGDSGILANAKIGNAKDTLTPYVLSMQDFKQAITRYALLYMRESGTDLPIIHTDRNSGARVQGAVWTRDHVLDSGTYVEFEYRNFTPQDEMTIANVVGMLVRENVIGLETARDKVGVENPTAENTRILADQAYKDPNVIRIASTFAIMDMIRGLDFDLDQFGQVMQQVQQAVGQPQGGPGGPPPGAPTPPGVPGGPPPGMPGSGTPPPPAPPGLPPGVLPPEATGALAGVLGQAGANLGPPGSVGVQPNGQNLQQLPLM